MSSAYGAYHSRPAFGRAGTRAAMQAAAPRALPSRAMPDESSDSFRIGRVFSHMLGVVGPNFITFVALIALAAVPERALYHLVHVDDKMMDLLSRLTLALCGLLLQIAIMRLSFDSFAGNKADFGACIGQAFRSFFPALGSGAIAALPVALASLLAVAPGVVLLLSWTMVLPVEIVEGAGILACFGRSAALTRGHRWKLLAVFLLLGFMLTPVLLSLQAVWGLPLSAHAIFFNENWLARLVFNAALGLMLAATYRELRAVEAAAD